MAWGGGGVPLVLEARPDFALCCAPTLVFWCGTLGVLLVDHHPARGIPPHLPWFWGEGGGGRLSPWGRS